jgi:tetratricopeptide (TPR) repeat protein
MQRENYSQARRPLTAALAFRPLKAEYHYMMAIAIEEDDEADLKRAEMYYAQAVELEADNATYWADYATYLCRIGNRQTGLKAIRKAYMLGITAADVVGQVAEVLRQEGCFEEASTKLRAALFRNRGDERFRRIWQHHQFQKLHEEQQQSQRAATGRKKGPVILPFAPLPQTGKFVELGGKTLRLDRAEPQRGPRSPLPLPFRRPPKG